VFGDETHSSAVVPRTYRQEKFQRVMELMRIRKMRRGEGSSPELVGSETPLAQSGRSPWPTSRSQEGLQGRSERFPVGLALPHRQNLTALQQWLTAAEISAGPLFRKVNRGGVVEASRLVPDAVRQILLKRAAKAGLKGTLAEPVSPHGLRAGFITTAYRNGVSDEVIMGHTRHRSLTTMRSYVRRAKLSPESPAGKLGL
jgi:hypothetical protein